MKKRLLFILFFLLSLGKVSASTGTVTCSGNDNSPLNVRDNIDGKYIGELKCNSKVEVIDENAGKTSSCNKWYKIKNDNISGYSCGEYIKIDNIIKPDPVLNLKGKVSCIENNDPLTVRNSIDGNVTDRLPCNKEMKIIDNKAGSSDRCSNWYKVSYDNKIGYVCGTYVETEVIYDPNDKNIIAYKEDLKKEGFPDSYIDDLTKIHIENPKWQFKLFNTNLDWNSVIENESVMGRNLVYDSYDIGYRSLEDYSYDWETDTFHHHPTEKNWWFAGKDAISFYMDPRNYLDSKSIFSFESLSYEEAFQTEEVVRKILDKTFMPEVYKKYCEDAYTLAFITAAKAYNVSPVHLASRILQEQGPNGSIASLGNEFTYNGNKYSGYFNFYNIGATGANPAIKGLVWAMGGVNHTQTKYNRPWNTPYKSIVGGASFLSEDYISLGQNTLYFQKFDVSRKDGNFVHQYMQNLTAQYTEGLKTYNSYSKIDNLLNEELVFIIPVYKNMPEDKVKAPVNKNPNNYLKSIKINDKELDNFVYDNLEYNLEVPASTDKINISAVTINDKATVKGLGDYTLKDGINNIEIIVTSEKGTKKSYKLTINKQRKQDEIVLSSNNKLKSLTIDEIKFDFDKDKLIYNLEVDFNISKINVSYELESDKATTNSNKSFDLVVGLNEISIKVIAEDKSERIYILNITRKESSLDNILSNSGVKYNDKYLYGIQVNSSTESFINNIKNISKNIIVLIKDKNDKVKNGTFATGDRVTIKSLNETKSFEVLIYGDVNGDANIDKLDYFAVLQHYYKYTEHKGVYKEAADVNHDGLVDKLDYFTILKDYYGYKKIEQ